MNPLRADLLETAARLLKVAAEIRDPEGPDELLTPEEALALLRSGDKGLFSRPAMKRLPFVVKVPGVGVRIRKRLLLKWVEAQGE